MFNQGGDFSKVRMDLKKPIKCFVKESFPHFLVTDGYFFVPVYFTQKALNEFKSKNSNISIVDLHSKVIILSDWSLEINKVNSSENFTSYANLELRLIVHSFKPNLQEKLNPTRYPTNLFRDDEMKTVIQHFRHNAIQKSLSKSSKDSLPDISKMGDGKKVSVESKGVVALKADKSGDFADFHFKEGHTDTVKLQNIFIQEKGKDQLKRLSESDHGAAKVKGGAKGKKKAASKAKGKGKSDHEDVKKRTSKIMKYTPSKSAGKKEGTPSKGKVSAKKSVGKKHTPAMPSPGGKKSTKTTDQMTMQQFKKYLEWHEQQKSKKKVLGKRSTGKSSAVSGKKSASKGKKSKK